MALRDVTLDMYRGEITVILGQSGSGKTTLISIIAGLCNYNISRIQIIMYYNTVGIQKPTSGSIRIGNIDIFKKPSARRRIGISQDLAAYFECLTIFEQLYYLCKVKHHNIKLKY